MNWLSKKIVISKLRNYFHIEDDRNIDISLFGKQSIKCNNLVLKTQLINTDKMLIHLKSCKITHIDIAFDSSKMTEEPLIIKIDKVQIILKFNQQRKQSNSKAANRQQIIQFQNTISTQQPYKTRTYIEQQIYFLKKIIGQFCISKFHLILTNIDVSIQYCFKEHIRHMGTYKQHVRYVGVQIGQIQMKQRMVGIKNIQQKASQEQLHICMSQGSVYLAVREQQNVLIKQKNSKEIYRGKVEIRKRYIMEKQVINAFYNIATHQLQILLDIIDINCSKLDLRQILIIIKYIQRFLSKSPTIRPGQGNKIQVEISGEKVKISQGTISWWQYTISRLIEKNMKHSSNKNILLSKIFRRYLFCLLYRYTHGYNKQIENKISEYEIFQESINIIKFHTLILQKIYRIQSNITMTQQQQAEIKAFIFFISKVQQSPQFIQNYKIKKISIKQIKKSEVFINYQNAIDYLKQYEILSQRSLSILLKLKKSRINILQKKTEKDFWSDIYLFKIHDLKHNRLDLANTYYRQQFLSNQKPLVRDFIIQLNNIQIHKNQDYQFVIKCQSVKLQDQISKQRIAKIKHLSFLFQKSILPLNFDSPNIMQVKVGLIFFHVELKFIQRILLIGYLVQNIQQQPQQQEIDTIDKFINEKVPKDKIFQAYSKTNTKIIINQIVIVIAVYQKNIFFSLQLKQLNYEIPVNKHTTLVIQQISVNRKSLQSIKWNNKSQREKILKVDEQWNLLENNCPLSAIIQKQSGKSVFNLVLPFLLIQISCQDLYYFINIISQWKSLFQNKILFGRQKNKIIKKSQIPQNIRHANISFLSGMNKNMNKQWQQSVDMEGIYVIFYAQSYRTPGNQIISILINKLVYHKTISYTQEKQQFKIKDIFVANCLGKGNINKNTLIQVMKGHQNKSPIQKTLNNSQVDYGLLMYSECSQNSENFFVCEKNTIIDLVKIRIQNQYRLNLESLYIFHSPQLFKNIMVIYKTAVMLSKQNFKQKNKSVDLIRSSSFKPIIEEQKQQLVYKKDFDQVTKIDIEIFKISILITNQYKPVFLICLIQPVIQHKTQLYISKYFITFKKLVIMDISQTSAPYPIILETTKITEANFIKYHSLILQQTYQRTSLITIKFDQTEVYFLKRKIKDLVNFILFIKDQLSINEQSVQSVIVQPPNKNYGLCYSIQFFNPKIIMPRNSLSLQVLYFKSETMIVRNYADKVASKAKENSINTSFNDCSGNYDDCSEVQNDPLTFKSFQKLQQNKKSSSNSSIYIYVDQANIISQKKQKIIDIKFIEMNYNNSTFQINIVDTVFINFHDDNQYRQIIRLSEQNIGQIPILFPDIVTFSTSRQVNFKTVFNINIIQIHINLQHPLILQISNLEGTFLMLRNNEKICQLTIANIKAKQKQNLFIYNHENILIQNQQSAKKKKQMKQDWKSQIQEKINSLLIKNKKQQKIFFQGNNRNKINQSTQLNDIEAEQLLDNSSKANKIIKWVSGMCMKCFSCCICCHKRQYQYEDNEVIDTINQNKQQQNINNSNKNKNQVKQNNLKPSFHKQCIQSYNQIINYTQKIDPSRLLNSRNQSKTIYLYFTNLSNNQKKMYMLIKKLCLILNQNKQLFSLMNFLKKPYTVVDRPDYVFSSNFNNFRPFNMAIEISQSTFEMATIKNEQKQRFIIKIDTIYEQGTKGDTRKGPGESFMTLNNIFELWFKRHESQIKLSDPLKFQYIKSQVTPFKCSFDNLVQGIQKFVLDGIYSQPIKIKIPVSTLNGIVTIFKKIFSTQQTQRQQESSPKLRKFVEQQNKKQPQKQVIKKNPIQRSGYNITKGGYISEINIQIITKTQTCLLSMKLIQIQFSGLNMANQFQQMSIIKILNTLLIEYLNLKTGNFQPFVEPWNFMLQSKYRKRYTKNIEIQNQIQNYKMKIVSIDQPVDKLRRENYVNGLNINFSNQLFHTYKEIQMKYGQMEYDQQQTCIDLTVRNENNYKNLFSNFIIPSVKQQQSNLEQNQHMISFPQRLKKFFGRQFDTDNIINKKNRKSFGMQKFNRNFQVQFLYHSYFDHLRRKKQITYRTPYRLLNLTQYPLQLNFYIPYDSTKWSQSFFSGSYYAITKQIYDLDFLFNIELSRRQILSTNVYENRLSINDQSLLQDQIMSINNNRRKKKYTSIRYILSEYQNKAQFNKVNSYNSKLIQKFFPYSNQDSRYIEPCDMVIKLDNNFISLVCVKTQYKMQTNKNNPSLKIYYDTFIIVTSPLTIYNFSTITFHLKVNGMRKMTLDPNTDKQISYFPKANTIYQTIIQFEEDILHTEFDFFNQELGTKEYYMEVNKMESVTIKSFRETQTTCIIYIIPNLVIKNQTNQQLQLIYNQKLFPIDHLSVSCLSNITPKTKIHIQLLYEDLTKHKIDFSNQVDIFVLKKKQSIKKNQQKKDSQKNIQKLTQQESKNININYKKPQYLCIDFVLNSSESNVFNIRQIIIRYQYQLTNSTSQLLTLFQNTQDSEIFSLKPNQRTYIHFYDILPKVFFLRIKNQKLELHTCKFILGSFPAKSFTLKFIKPQKQIKQRFLRIDVFQNNYSHHIIASQCIGQNDCPIQIKNSTQYTIKITQNQQLYMIKPDQKCPFSWSNFVQRNDEIQVQIEGVTKKYSLNQKSQFQPIVLKQDETYQSKEKNKRRPSTLYKKQQCFILYNEIKGNYIVILDLIENKLRVHGTQDQNQNCQIDMINVYNLDNSTNQIQLHLSDQGSFKMKPNTSSMEEWIQLFRYSMSINIRDKIFFSIQSAKNSLIFFFYSSKNNDGEDLNTSTKQLIIPTINISLINSVPQQLILLYAGGVRYVQIDKSRSAYKKSLHLETSERTLKINKIKINNQMPDAVNPVILSQIKKSNYPFIELKILRQQIVTNNIRKSNEIIHYKHIAFFLDEAEMMVDYILFNHFMSLKKEIEHMTNQYAVNSEPQTSKVYKMSQTKRKISVSSNNQQPINQVYINYMQIKPIKMTISVSLSTKKGEEVQRNLIGFIRLIPFGVDNAIINIQSFLSFHIFLDSKQVVQSLKTYYLYQIRKQILFNAGSYQILAPIGLVQGLGVGMKNIFYDPFYQLVKTKQIKAVGATFCQGVLTLLSFLFSFLIKVINIIVKLVALLTLDKQFQTGRQMFRKQIFKSPMQGLIHGGKYVFKIIKSFFINLYQWPAYYCEKHSCIGGIFGLILAILSVLPWTVKLVVTTYDYIYVIGLGLINWGYYEQSAMKRRSRPIRNFPSKTLKPYNYDYSQAYQIIESNQIQQVENEEVYFVKVMKNDNNNFLILSNYRIIYANSKYSSCDQIKLYQIKKIEINPSKNQNTPFELVITLSIPNQHKVLLVTWTTTTYSIQFPNKKTLDRFLLGLASISPNQELSIPKLIPQQLEIQVEHQLPKPIKQGNS